MTTTDRILAEFSEAWFGDLTISQGKPEEPEAQTFTPARNLRQQGRPTSFRAGDLSTPPCPGAAAPTAPGATKGGKYDLIVTRHRGLVEWLRDEGFVDETTPVVERVRDGREIRGLHVIGVLPLWLAVHAATVTEAVLDLPPALRGRELSAAQVREHFAELRTFAVRVMPA